MKIALGIIPAVITPLNEDETIDVGSLEKLLEHLLGLQIRGLFFGGTIGEGNALRDHDRFVLYREAVRITRGRVPVMASVSDTGTQRVLESVKQAVKANVDAVALTPRLVFPRRMPDETLRMVEAVARESPVPVWFYENPEMTPVRHTFEQIAEIVALPNIVGLKFTVPDRDLFTRCVRELPASPPCFNGVVADMAFAAQVGGGAISGIASMVPELCLRIFEAGRSGDLDLAEQLQQAINSTYQIYRGKGWPYWPAAQKHVLVRRGFFRTSVATAPFLRLGADDVRFIDEQFEKMEDWIFQPDLFPAHTRSAPERLSPHESPAAAAPGVNEQS
jgi:4-hydroxy-tetrahydrodipicolinate synthase